MKKYRLKQWYPSLPKWVEIGAIARYIKVYGGYFIENYSSIEESEVENNSDFWELIEEEEHPLFITEDGVEITDGMQSVIAIDSDINVEHTRYQWANKKDLIFAHESNADEYIWRNKPLFSYEDFMKWGNVPFPKAIEQLAKERVEKL